MGEKSSAEARTPRHGAQNTRRSQKKIDGAVPHAVALHPANAHTKCPATVNSNRPGGTS